MDSPIRPHLSADEVCAAFPLHLAVDRTLRVTAAGPLWGRVRALVGTRLTDELQILRPRATELTHDFLANHTRDVFFLQVRGSTLKVRGQVLTRPEGTLWLLTPFVKSARELAEAGLDFRDLALHDPTVDLMLVLQTQATSLADARNLMKMLRDKQQSLVAATRRAEEAQHEAERHAQAKQEFLAVMSHELRTPLNGVLGMAELLVGTRLDDEQRVLLETLRTSGDSLLSVINDILDYSRIEQGRLALEEIPFDPRRVVEQVVDMLAPRAQAGGLQFAANIAADVPGEVLGDETRVRQVLVNLASNALKFTLEGHVLIGVEYREGELICRVHDTGIGIAQERLPLLFQPFTQADASTTRRFGGSGLGLSICRHVCDAMGGRIHVSTAEGIGSCFSFHVPLPSRAEHVQWKCDWRRPVAVIESSAITREGFARALRASGAKVYTFGDTCRLDEREWEAVLLPFGEPIPPSVPTDRIYLVGELGQLGDLREASANFAGYFTRPCKVSQLEAVWGGTATEPASPSEQTQRSGRVLVVEDNAVNRRLAVAMLERHGYTVDLAEDGAQAIERLRDRTFDLVLMDCQMPVLDGFEATRRIRRELRLELPIVAMTANAMAGDRARCLAAGMDDYVTKPVRGDVLVAAIERNLGRDRRGGSWQHRA